VNSGTHFLHEVDLKVLVFDFDGVLCDSNDECLLVSWNTWQTLRDSRDKRREIADFTSEEQGVFRKMRNYVRGAGEYYTFYRAMNDNIDITCQADFDALNKKWQEEMADYKAVFFEERNVLRSEQPEFWLSLHKPYIAAIESLRLAKEEIPIRIATMKDKASVNAFLLANGISLDSKHIQDQSMITSKLQGLDRVREAFDYEARDITFIDDNVTHLLDPISQGYDCWFASWGYHTPEHMQLVKKYQVSILELGKINTQLKLGQDAAN
jgi:phosphoglycolate phosphatase-like HAD superfamily hydrolase